jgi:hypothetical protein
MLGHGIVGVENLGGDLDKVSGKRFRFFCFPIRWYMGDGSMVRCVAEIDESELNDVPERTYTYCGTGYGPAASVKFLIHRAGRFRPAFSLIWCLIQPGRRYSMKKISLTDVNAYEAPGHFAMTAMRLHGKEETGATKFWIGLSHFLPGGGADWGGSPGKRCISCWTAK